MTVKKRPISRTVVFCSASRLMRYAALIGSVITHSLAMATPVTYGFDFEITSDDYRYGWTGPLLAKGSKGSGTVVLEYQTAAESTTIVEDVNASYAVQPFRVTLGSGTDAFALIDSTKSGQYGRRGITVQDIPSWDVTYDTIVIEGFSGLIESINSSGNPIFLDLHTQLGLFALSNVISDYNLSEENIWGMSNALIWTSFNVQDAITGGQVNGKVSNFHLINDVRTVPEPGTAWLVGFGLLSFWLFGRRTK